MGVKNMMACVKNSNKNCGGEEAEKKKINGTVVLMKKNFLDLNDFGSSILDRLYEIFGKRVSIQLISSTHRDPCNGSKGKIGKAARLEDWVTKRTAMAAGEVSFSVTFDWEESMGAPGGLMVKNHHHSQFYLKTVTLEHVPGHGTLHFVCNSWVYPVRRYKDPRIFFANKAYLPCSTPEPLQHYREQELVNLRGTGSGKLKEWDRVYDYAFYNDLGLPDKGPKYARPVLGGSQEYPYPRRGRTGRGPTKTDPKSEKRLFLLSLNIYVPRDERFNHIKFSDFLGYAAKSIGQVVRPELKAIFDRTPNEFDSFKDVLDLYGDGVKLPKQSVSKIKNRIPLELVKELLRSDGEKPLTFPMPDVIKDDKSAWREDEEFGREMLAGVNPVVIRRLQDFPPASKLDPKEYGNQTSTITKEHLEPNMNGLNVQQALEENKLFILDHHDALMPYLTRINSTASKIYATRTILLLQDDGTLKPLAIELSLPKSEKDNHGCISDVFTPSAEGVCGTIWQLAKAYVAVNDSGYHQLISHWLNTHAVIEPFIIATNRQLSVMHPINKLLQPHFRDTMNINALARQILINAGGILEMTVFPAKYAMELSSVVYKNWVFTEQALPADLLKRGVAVEDPTQPHGLRLLIEDYPFAVDGLEIWSAIQMWCTEYCSIYYLSDDMVKADAELQKWWTELRTEGHGDKKDEPWWPQMQTRSELIHTCTIIIWVASALHAAVNFGQYPYAGYLPNRPTVSRRFMPKRDSAEYAELESDPERGFLKTITSQLQTLLGVSLIEILSRHSTDEIYLGQSESPYWTSDNSALEAFKRFGTKLVEIEKSIATRNDDKGLKNRLGPVKVSYTLLYPNTSDYTREGGLTGKGIPNSISI
ncbi:probable linoleate 9S-lipoxygenase 5 [Cynara cardunculus var. scolymus]|uniref:probable linoleate 9S-lipoxygenase 5 n=1 Tax=Cynara cardunculus var. scolymus TaxID=59895 RepID=UPI000D629230|nr:probable linoleate 9S-lipoxygenase 5 [Cynara cardunculus var. scolymus]